MSALVPSITPSSTDITNGGVIPPLHKGISCAQPNINPQISWVLTNLASVQIESFELYIVDNDVVGTGPGNKFLHWGATNIPNTIFGVAQNAGWTAGVAVLPSDYGSGDAVNGYNGPCCPTALEHTYEIIVIAKITLESQGYLGLTEVTSSHSRTWFKFLDNSNNTIEEPPTGECGETYCPPGTTLVGDMCQLIETTSAILESTVYTAFVGSQIDAYGEWGTRFYNNIDGLPLPLTSDPTSAILEDNLGVPVPFSVVTGTLPWEDSGGGAYDGRLNTGSIWATAGAPDPNPPLGEWIGFSACVIAPSTGEYCIGLGADNRMKLSINGIEIALFDSSPSRNFKYWHIIPITLNEGENIIELEGYNDGDEAAFAAEVYNASSATLSALTTVLTLEPYILWSTHDRVGQDFEVGESSGYICPGGTSYDSCNVGNCTTITYTAPLLVECCYIIENCKDEFDTLLIQFDASVSPTPFSNYVYTFNALNAQGPLLSNKCWILRELVVCPGGGDVADVTIVQQFGPEINLKTSALGCLICDPSILITSCDGTQTEYIQLATARPPQFITAGNIYTFDGLEGCWIAGPVAAEPVTIPDVMIDTDYGTDDCSVCDPCYQFKNCDTLVDIFVRFITGTTLPTVNNVYLLSDPTGILPADICHQYIGTATCTPGTEDYIDVTIVEDLECNVCDICIPYYKLVDCADPTNIQYIYWDKNATPLDESQVYIFDFAPDTCFMATLEFTPCEFRYSACGYNFFEKLVYIENVGGGGAGNPFEYAITSLIINGTEYITGTPPFYTLDYSVPGIDGLNTVTATNSYGKTYTEQVDGFNSIFAALGLDELLKAQLSRDDAPLFENCGGFYIIKRSDVITFSITLQDDNPGGLFRIYSEVDQQIEFPNSMGQPTSHALCYEYIKCTDANNDEFVIIDRVVQEPNVPE